MMIEQKITSAAFVDSRQVKLTICERSNPCQLDVLWYIFHL